MAPAPAAPCVRPASLALVPLLVLGACAAGGSTTSWEADGEAGLYRVRVATAAPPAMGIVALDVEVDDESAGVPAADVAVDISADMPAHGHGIDPVDVTTDADGRCAPSLMLPMGGGWRLAFHVDGEAGVDVATVDLDVR